MERIQELEAKVGNALEIWDKATKLDVGDDTCCNGSKSKPANQKSARPWSRSDFEERLATYTTTNWFGKPDIISRRQCAARGWTNSGPSELHCPLCNETIRDQTPATLSVMEQRVAAQKIFNQLNNSHHIWCPWRSTQCNGEWVNEMSSEPNSSEKYIDNEDSSDASNKAHAVAERLNSCLGI